MNKYRVFSKLWFLALLLVTFVAGCAENGAEVVPSPKTLVSIAVTPATATIAIGGNQQYVVAATWSDQTFTYVTSSTSTVWSKVDVPTVSGDVVATLSPDGSNGGLAAGTAAGTSTITAQYTFDGITKSATAGLIVSPDAALTIIPGASCSISSGATIPTVTSSNPTSGNQYVTTSTTGVANSGKSIIATFSLAMDPATLNSATSGALSTFTLKESVSGNNVPGTVSVDVATKKVATFTTSAALNADTNYTASITVDAKSATGVAISCAYEWDFKTIIPAQTGLPVINLGKAASFGIAATTGVVNVGATTVNGDVVLDPNTTCNAVTVGTDGLIGACAGAPPTITGTVISPLYPDAGVTSGAVIVDLRAAYTSLSPGLLSTGVITIPDGTVMGAGAGTALVERDNLFFPGIYKTTSGGMLITGDITLDASGDPDALFVFQSDSTLGTAATLVADPHTRILLVNGAKASNVFWWVGSDATLGTNTEFQGNILAYRDVTMSTGATSCGRLFAGAFTDGKFTFGANIVSVPGNINAPASCK